jgi:hypothetical protein
MAGSHNGGNRRAGGTGLLSALIVHMQAAANHVKKNAEINPDPFEQQVARFQRIRCAKTGGGESHP